MMTDQQFVELVDQVNDLRDRLEGRLPHSVSLKFNDFMLGTAIFTWPERGYYLAAYSGDVGRRFRLKAVTIPVHAGRCDAVVALS